MIKQKMTQYTVAMKNEPGELARVTQILAKEGVILSGISSPSVSNVGFCQFVARENVARRPLEQAGYEVFESPCFQVDISTHPEELNRLTRCLAEEDINILNLYGTGNHGESWKLTVVVDKPERAHTALAKLGEAVAA